jgi:hypothetical protein
VALVITLILLSVITFLAITFLLVTRRERAQVTLSINQTDAELAVITGTERAKAEILTRIWASNQLLSVDIMMSTNTDIPAGPFNVPGTFSGQVRQPRAPVFIDTNRNGSTGPLDYRYYLDINRNGMFDSNVAELSLWGDPEWIAVPNRIGRTNDGNNYYLYRYAYMILPAGRSLDINFIHNQGKRLDPKVDGFFRNQGVGGWEVNLAAFLRDLNTNAWRTYGYDNGNNLTLPSAGTTFEDAPQFAALPLWRQLLELEVGAGLHSGGRRRLRQ